MTAEAMDFQIGTVGTRALKVYAVSSHKRTAARQSMEFFLTNTLNQFFFSLHARSECKAKKR